MAQSYFEKNDNRRITLPLQYVTENGRNIILIYHFFGITILV